METLKEELQKRMEILQKRVKELNIEREKMNDEIKNIAHNLRCNAYISYISPYFDTSEVASFRCELEIGHKGKHLVTGITIKYSNLINAKVEWENE